MQIKNIIFDVGNVIVKWSPVDIVKHTFPEWTQEQQQFIFNAIFRNDIWTQLNLGKISEAKAKLKYLESNEILDAPNTDRLFNYIKSSQLLIPETVEIIEILYHNGYNLLALTDNIKEVVKYLQQQYDFWKFFSHVTVSANVGLMKPSREIFDYVIQTNKLLPSETLFIDDHPPNINTANTLGLHTILFSDPERALQELVHLGVNTIKKM